MPLIRHGLRQPSYFRRKQKKEARQFEPVVFKSVRRNPFVPQTKIKMKNSVHGYFKDGSHYSLDATKYYWVDQAKADEFIVKGYAEGQLSRTYSDDEVAAIRASITVISLDQEGLING
jgi:hypothetical protein